MSQEREEKEPVKGPGEPSQDLERRQRELINEIEEDPAQLQAYTNEIVRDLSHPKGLLGRLGYRTSTG